MRWFNYFLRQSSNPDLDHVMPIPELTLHEVLERMDSYIAHAFECREEMKEAA